MTKKDLKEIKESFVKFYNESVYHKIFIALTYLWIVFGFNNFLSIDVSSWYFFPLAFTQIIVGLCFMINIFEEIF